MITYFPDLSSSFGVARRNRTYLYQICSLSPHQSASATWGFTILVPPVEHTKKESIHECCLYNGLRTKDHCFCIHYQWTKNVACSNHCVDLPAPPWGSVFYSTRPVYLIPLSHHVVHTSSHHPNHGDTHVLKVLPPERRFPPPCHLDNS